MVNCYFETIPIVDKRQAKVLGSGSGWEVLELLRESGVEGSTADEISERLDLPKSTVYNILSDLSAAHYIDSRRYKKRIGRPNKEAEEEENRTGKQKRIYMESISWGDSSFTLDFDRFLVEEVDKIIYDSDIDKVFSVLVDKIILKMKSKSETRVFLPSSEDCPHCHHSHEAREFASALIEAIADRIRKSEELADTLKKHGYIID
jgi:DNA-binding transcriptional ArsR family regulator